MSDGLEKLRALAAIAAELIDPDECRYDHHGYCQSHSLHERPCPHERGRALLEADGE